MTGSGPDQEPGGLAAGGVPGSWTRPCGRAGTHARQEERADANARRPIPGRDYSVSFGWPGSQRSSRTRPAILAPFCAGSTKNQIRPPSVTLYWYRA